MVPVNCSHCGQVHEAESFPSINVALDPQLKARVKDGSLFVSECPFCGTRNLVKYQTLYHDPEQWKTVMKNAMETDVSWNGPAKEYIALYRMLTGKK